MLKFVSSLGRASNDPEDNTVKNGILCLQGLMAVRHRALRLVRNDPLYQAYHDTEWGVPLHDDRALFGFSRSKAPRPAYPGSPFSRARGYRRAFANFDLTVVARFGDAETRRPC